jgi:hypothetical protein
MATLLLTSTFPSPTNFPVYNIFPLLYLLLLVVSQFSPHLPFYWVVRCKILLLHHSSHFHLPLHFGFSYSFFLSSGNKFRFLSVRGLILETDRRQVLEPLCGPVSLWPHVVQYSQRLLRSIIQGPRRTWQNL